MIALTAGALVRGRDGSVVPGEFEDGGASKAKVLALLLGAYHPAGAAADLLEASWLKSIYPFTWSTHPSNVS